jgi:hypothetical protein
MKASRDPSLREGFQKKLCGAERGTRTPTDLSVLRILSPLRLPIPPSRPEFILHGGLTRPNHGGHREQRGSFETYREGRNGHKEFVRVDSQAASTAPAYLDRVWLRKRAFAIHFQEH